MSDTKLSERLRDHPEVLVLPTTVREWSRAVAALEARLERAMNELRGACSCRFGDDGETAITTCALHAALEAERDEWKRKCLGGFSRKRFESAPCYLCGYNGAGYFQPDQHSCAEFYHSRRARLMGDAK